MDHDLIVFLIYCVIVGAVLLVVRWVKQFAQDILTSNAPHAPILGFGLGGCLVTMIAFGILVFVGTNGYTLIIQTGDNMDILIPLFFAFVLILLAITAIKVGSGMLNIGSGHQTRVDYRKTSSRTHASFRNQSDGDDN